MLETLTHDNFVLYGAKHYTNPSCTDTLEFFEDLNRFKYIKRLFNKYKETGELKERLILNHVMILYNVFGKEAATRMIFCKLEGFEVQFKPFLVLLNVLPDTVHGINDKKVIYTTDIAMDQNIIAILRKI